MGPAETGVAFGSEVPIGASVFFFVLFGESCIFHEVELAFETCPVTSPAPGVEQRTRGTGDGIMASNDGIPICGNETRTRGPLFQKGKV